MYFSKISSENFYTVFKHGRKVMTDDKLITSNSSSVVSLKTALKLKGKGTFQCYLFSFQVPAIVIKLLEIIFRARQTM